MWRVIRERARVWAVAGLLLGAPVVGMGCKPDVCQRMTLCCQSVKDIKGMGSACTRLAEKTRKPETCSSVMQTVNYMLKDRKQPIPPACRMPDAK